MPPHCRLSLLAMVLTVVHVCCEVRVLKVWYGCAVQENTSVVDIVVDTATVDYTELQQKIKVNSSLRS